MRMPILSYVPYSLAASALLGGVIAACQAPLDIRPAKSQHSDHATAAIPHVDIPGVSPLLTRDCVKNPKLRRGPPHNDEPKNGITVEALLANRALTDVLAHRSLSALSQLTSATPEGKAALRVLAKDDGMNLTKYVVSCALNPCQEVTVNEASDSDFHVHGMTFSGELGLCDGGSASYGDWYSGPPSQACKEAVSACVLARVNAHHKKVVISIRDPEGYISLQDHVPVETEYREGGGTPIPSFAPCPSVRTPNLSLPPNISTENCGFSPQYVGRCASGSKVTVKVGEGAKVRVCQGLYGCEAEQTKRWYSSPFTCGSAGTTCTPDGITFACPSTYVGEVRMQGYYSVMVKPPPGTSATPHVIVTTENCSDGQTSSGHPRCEYPAKEKDVFTVAEGAFYGNIFETPAAAPVLNSAGACPPKVVPDMLSGHQYACYSNVWSDNLAHLSDRFCAGPYSPCFLNPPGKCGGVDPKNGCTTASSSSPLCLDSYPPTPSSSCRAGGCAGATQTNDPSLFKDCHGTIPQSVAWHYPMTVYLNHPCDLSTDGGACQCELAPPLIQ